MGRPHDRERGFHDQLAAELKPDAMPRRDPDELERALLARTGSLAGLRVLELGCGSGDLTLQLLDAGADLTALDLSPAMVARARTRVERFVPQASVDLVTGPAEDTGLPEDSFDVVVGKWILHHVDTARVAAEIARVLRPGGRAVFIENSGRNPVLALARRHVVGRWGIPRLGTLDEHPLVRADYDVFRASFASVALFYPDFHFLQLFDRQVLRYRHPRISDLIARVDRLVYRRVPALRRYSFHVIVEFARDPQPAAAGTAK
jgi:ubiquinone/menaquinone biosynthesis C-methylase UbiE